MPAKSMTGTQPELAIVVWRGELSTLEARLRLSPSELTRLKYLCRNQRGTHWTVDVTPANTNAALAALKRRLAVGDGG